VAKLKSVAAPHAENLSLSLSLSLSLPLSLSLKKEFKPARIRGKGEGYTSVGSIVPVELPGYELLTRA